MDLKILIVGAGPVGLITALNLAKEGIDVTLLETLPDVEDSPRAMGYGPAGVIELERAGVAAEARAVGMDESMYEANLRWITIDGKEVASLNTGMVKDGYPPVMCGQNALAHIIKRHLSQYPKARVLWNHTVTTIDQTPDQVTVTCKTSDGEVKISGTYLIGADGARSTVRKLIGCTYDGFTYDKQVVATNVMYPFSEYGYSEGQFIIHPEHFALIGKIDPTGLYRVSYAEDGNLTHDEVRANLDYKFNQMFPGPKPVKYELKMFSPYRLHQRCSSSFKVGRVVLAGDAAHACNPFGGMGLTTGLVDAGGLSDCIIGIAKHGCDDSILEKYAEIRRKLFLEVTDPLILVHFTSNGSISRENVERLYKLNPETAATEYPLFRQMNQSDDFKRQMLSATSPLCQYFPT